MKLARNPSKTNALELKDDFKKISEIIVNMQHLEEYKPSPLENVDELNTPSYMNVRL